MSPSTRLKPCVGTLYGPPNKCHKTNNQFSRFKGSTIQPNVHKMNLACYRFWGPDSSVETTQVNAQAATVGERQVSSLSDISQQRNQVCSLRLCIFSLRVLQHQLSYKL